MPIISQIIGISLHNNRDGVIFAKVVKNTKLIAIYIDINKKLV